MSASRYPVSGYCLTRLINNAGCPFGLARPCSQFSNVRTLIRRYAANKAREIFNSFRTRISCLGVSCGAGRYSSTCVRSVILPSRSSFSALTPSVSSANKSLFAARSGSFGDFLHDLVLASSSALIISRRALRCFGERSSVVSLS